MTAQELKNSILQLAVQGKLVPQCKDDEPASELTRQIIEKRNQIEKNHIKTLSSISEEEIRFEVPESWILLRLGDFCQVYNGNSINATVKQEKYSKQCDGYSFIATKDLGFDHIIDYDNGIYIPKEETGFKIAIAGSILLCMEGGSAGKKSVSLRVMYVLAINCVALRHMLLIANICIIIFKAQCSFPIFLAQ